MRLETGTVILSAVHSLAARDVCHYHSLVRYRGMSRLKMCSSKALFIHNGNSCRTTKQNKSRREGQRWHECRTASPRRPVVSTWGQFRWSVPGDGTGEVGSHLVRWPAAGGSRAPAAPAAPAAAGTTAAARTWRRPDRTDPCRASAAVDGTGRPADGQRRTVRGGGQGRRWTAPAAGDRDGEGGTRGQGGRNKVESKATASYVGICKTHKHSDNLRWPGGL